MRWRDLIVPVGADQQQVPHLRVRDKMFDQVKGRGVQPLQIIEEQRERVLRPSKHAEEPPEHQLEPILPVLRWEFGNWRLLTDDESKLRDEIDHQLAVRAKRVQQRGAPSAHLRVALAEDLVDKALEGLGQRRIRDISLVLIELAGREETARRHQFPVQFIHYRGLTDAGISGHEHKLGCAVDHNAVEGREQGGDLALPPV